MPKDVIFLGDSRSAIRSFPQAARLRAGLDLQRLQAGLDPHDWKPMKSIGAGVRELRIHDETGAYRIIYLAKFADMVLVLHAFTKKTQKTPQSEIELAARRLKLWKSRT